MRSGVVTILLMLAKVYAALLLCLLHILGSIGCLAFSLMAVRPFKRLALLFMLLFVTNIVHAQTYKARNLKVEISNAKPQTNIDTCISISEYNYNQALYASVCNILQYITVDGKITNKKAFIAAVRNYLNLIDPRARSPSE